MAFAPDSPKIWPVPPDWSGGMQETLAWATDVSQASATAATHARSYRLGPRRSFAFEVAAVGGNHRLADMLLAGWRGSWLLPIWPDVQRLAAPLAEGSETIPCHTAGFDFAAGGRALLYVAPNVWEVVSVLAVEADHIALGEPTTAAWARGARLYPLRRARLQDGAEAVMSTAASSRRTLVFDVSEPCDWPALASLPEYFGHPVLNSRPDRSDDPSHSYAGLTEAVDFGAAMPVVGDLPGIALKAQRDSWKLIGRDRNAWYRSLLYLLRGRQRPIWVPSWNADLKPAAAIAGGSTTLVIEWAGYSLFALGRPNRRDLAIHLRDGRVLYRRVVDAFEAGPVESLTVSASLDPASIAPGAIAQISIMALSTLANDTAEIQHLTDAGGQANATIGWQAVVPDV